MSPSPSALRDLALDFAAGNDGADRPEPNRHRGPTGTSRMGRHRHRGTTTTTTTRRRRIRTFCRGATAHGQFVYGLSSSSSSSSSSSGGEERGVLWKTRLPSDVTTLSSSPHPRPHLVVATTSAGDVTLLDGRTGRVLVTRNVVAAAAGSRASDGESDEEEEDGCDDEQVPLLVAWIAGGTTASASSTAATSAAYDDSALLVETRMGDDDASASTSTATHFMVVTNLKSLLDDGDGAPSADATATAARQQKLRIAGLSLPREVRAISGMRLPANGGEDGSNGNLLRLFACTAEGSLVAYDCCDFDFPPEEAETGTTTTTMTGPLRVAKETDVPLAAAPSGAIAARSSSAADGDDATLSSSSYWFVDQDVGISRPVSLGGDDVSAFGSGGDSGNSNSSRFVFLSAYSVGEGSHREERTALLCVDAVSLAVASRYELDPRGELADLLRGRNCGVAASGNSGPGTTPSRSAATGGGGGSSSSSKILTTPGTSASGSVVSSRLHHHHRYQQRPKVLALEPVPSCSDDTFAVALAVSAPPPPPASSRVMMSGHRTGNGGAGPGKTTTGVLVLQWAAEETMGLRIVSSQPHVLYCVPLSSHQQQPATIQSVELAATVAATEDTARAASVSDRQPYGVRIKLWPSSRDSNDADPACCYKVFCPTSCGEVGEVGRLLELKRFDEVDSMMKSISEDRFRDEFACVSPGQVTWKRLQCLLQQGRLDDAAVLEQAQSCFRRLAANAVSSTRNGCDDGLRYLLEASSTAVQSLSEPSLEEMVMVIKALVSTLDRVQQALVDSNDYTRQLEIHKKKLQDRLAAIQFLSQILEESSNGDPRSDGGSNKKILFAEPFHSIRSPSHLFELLVQHGYFSVAENLFRSSPVLRREWLTTEVLVRSMLKLDSHVAPHRYVSLLSDVVLPSLSLGHELLGALRSWACRTADALESGSEGDQNGKGLEAAILLLDTVDKGIKKLQVAVHSSFAVSDPFIVRGECRSTKRQLRSGDSLSDSLDSPFTSTITPSPHLKNKKQISFKSQDGVHSVPTILDMGVLKRGATKSRLQVVGVGEVGEEACVEDKLRDSLCLCQARQAGLDRKVVSLRSFVQQGGALFVAKELVALFTARSDENNDTIHHSITETVKHFCEAFGVDYDKALLEYVVGRCRVKTAVDRAVQESSSIARCCSSDVTKSHAALVVLRASLLCKRTPDWLSRFSKDAVLWASSDSSLQSEIQEASRLLLIDSIVLKYCGSGARELFQVDNPTHAVRLMEFVTRHVHEESVLSDALSLCDAYIHLSTCDAGSSLVEKAVLLADPELCTSFMDQIYLRDAALAEKVLAGVVSFSEELLVESSVGLRRSSNPTRVEAYRQQGRAASECASAVIGTVLQHTRTISNAAAAEIQGFLRNSNSLDCLREDFLRITRLQSECSIWMSLADLSSRKRIVSAVSTLLQPVLEALLSEEQNSGVDTMVARARRACSLLVGGSTKDANETWVIVCAKATIDLVQKHRDENLIEIMRVLGMFDTNQNDVTALLSIALALCKEATVDEGGSDCYMEGMHRIAKAASLLRDRALSYAADSQLPATVSFGALVETACEMLVRADEGRGEALDTLRQSMRAHVWKQTLPPCLKDAQSRLATGAPVPLRRGTALHKSWYIGDGLLLPPREALSHSVRFCRNILGDLNASSQVMEFLRRSGAHFLSLRVLASTVVHFTSTPRALSKSQRFAKWDSFASDASKASASLAERSIGGSSQIGITSGVIDSQLSVAFLLSLRLKQAFKMYKSSLPTALKSHDFNRLSTLANIGMVACSAEDAGSFGAYSSVGWRGQRRFFEQCQMLVTKAKWWTTLREYGVKFEPHRFDEKGGGNANTGTSSTSDSSYAASLLLPAIRRMSVVHDASEVLEILTSYAQDFGLSRELVVRKQIEWYLSPPTDDDIQSQDVRFDLNKCECVVKTCLRILDSSLKRCEVLRRCLVNLERSEASGQDYERFSLVLAFYHEALIRLVDQDPPARSGELERFEEELELVDRRRDALTILSAFFSRDQICRRPEITRLFLPLRESFECKTASSALRLCGILGAVDRDSTKQFDPLEALEPSLSGSRAMAATTALAPMSISLGLPQGYIHVRSLILKFQRVTAGATNFPSFENDVIPVFNRIRSSGERTQLAEWCGMQYLKNDEEKLKCFEVALKFAMEYSSEIENRRRHVPSGSKGAEAAEQEALEAVKRISSVKAALSDVLRVQAILRRASPSSQGALPSIIHALLTNLDRVVQEQQATPENLINFLLTTGSLAAANAALDSERPLSTVHLREFCSVVHEACQTVAEQHSHVQSGRHCRRLARRWLFYGDLSAVPSEDTSCHDNDDARNAIASTILEGIQEDETVNFVMDLADLHDDEKDWNTDGPQSTRKQRFTSEEEPSATKTSSFREESEMSCQRSAIRIAFVLAFADETDRSAGFTDRENSVASSNQPVSSQRKKRSGLLAKLETKKESRQEQEALEHSRDLLRIAFASKASTSAAATLFNCSVDHDDSVYYGTSRESQPKTVTFAMRHRALRAASILCPQEALERVIHDEGFLDGVVVSNNNSAAGSALKTCAFGAFVAKEIEEMGLSLPHSDLGHLSSMHYPSYARTLWRDHRDGNQKGRMLLLLLELSLRTDDANIDASFVHSLLREMTRLHLPRTLLLATERIAKYEDCRLASQPSLIGGPALKDAVSTLAGAVISDSQRLVTGASDGPNTEDAEEAMGALRSVRRLVEVAAAFGVNGSDGQEQLAELAKGVSDLSSSCSSQNRILSDGLQAALSFGLRRLRRRKDLDRNGGKDDSGYTDDQVEEHAGNNDGSGQSSRLLSDALQRLEALLAYHPGQ